ncbi:hypothetical protein MLPF_0202 [Mycobacterium lepromatosis]|nr:hypothetical protein MLPF_0202 [Mycobacterium lepromatosis]
MVRGMPSGAAAPLSQVVTELQAQFWGPSAV